MFKLRIKKEKDIKQKGITLIALIVTIIVLLILAGVTIATLTGENGILTRANDAKTSTEIAEEKEKVELSATATLAEKLGEEIEIEKLKTELGNYFETGKYEVEEGINQEGIDGYIVTITENDQNGRKYFVDKNGNVSEYIEMEKGEAEGTGGTNFKMNVGAIEVEFLEGTGYSTGDANEPLLDEKTMIPIKYNEETSKWRATTKNDPDWYKYDTENRKWANAMLSDGAFTPETIPMNRDLEENELGSMFVWIPRYAYKIVYFDNETDKKNYIESGRTDKTKIIGYSDSRGMVDAEGKVRKDVTENIPGIKVGDNYRPHPVFEKNEEQGGWDKQQTGIWIGKFETTEKTSEKTKTNMILPNQTSQRNLKVSTMFNRAQEIGINLNMTLDSHMLKNTEWGATAYLAESKYGRNGTEVSVNQCSSFITGAGKTEGTNIIYEETTYSKTTEGIKGTDQAYNGKIGVLSSTTGNVYGIYDMSGGASEYVMGIYGTTLPSIGGTGFTDETIPERKYYNLYTTKNNSNIGDALYETIKWNNDEAGVNENFVNSYIVTFARGRIYENSYKAGIFGFNIGTGTNYLVTGFRVGLAIK